VPRWAIEESARRRAAGDWAGACAACLVDVAITLDSVSRAHGAGTAARLEEDLRHLVPDLVHWHLPRVLGGRTVLATDRTVLLARYAPGAHLYLTMPTTTKGPQRVTLRFGDSATAAPARRGRRPATEDWTAARHLWDARHAHELRERCGGGPDRAPFCRPDGTPLADEELPAADPGHRDPAARTEWITLLHERGDVEAAFAAAGIGLDATVERVNNWYERNPAELLRKLPLDVAGLGRELPRVAARTGQDRWRVRVHWRDSLLLERTGPGGGLSARVVSPEESERASDLPRALWRRLPDLDLLRVRAVPPRQLHPLVAASLLPGLPASGGPFGPPEPEAPQPFRVRCRAGAWHQVAQRDGRLTGPHTDEEHRREQAMRAFGGAVSGCFAVEQAWRTGEGRLPKALRAQRLELFQRVEHGDTAGVMALLDAGYDPFARDARGRGLLHLVHMLDHEVLLPRLLRAGLDLESKDRKGRTPLYSVVEDGGSRAAVEALLEAGARIDVVCRVDAYDETALSLAQTVRRYRRADLAFLARRVRTEYPGVNDAGWDEYTEIMDGWRERADHLDHLEDPPEDEDARPPEDDDAREPREPGHVGLPPEDAYPPLLPQDLYLREPPADEDLDAPPEDEYA
jgi:hypothetical protein